MNCKALSVVLLVCVALTNAQGSKYKVVCYLGSWANYRTGDGRFTIEDIDPKLCTHAIYGFAKLANNKITVYDPWLDLKDNSGLGAFQRFSDLKKVNPQLSTLIAIGGWNEGSSKYSAMAADPAARKVFVQSVIDFCKKYDFNGLDVDWEYPANRGGSAADKKNFVLLLKELKEALQPLGLLLSAAVSAGQGTIDTAYDIPGVAKYLDFINVMAYDLHGSWEKQTGHNAPLYARPDEPQGEKSLNVDYAINYWIKNGAPRNKIILGMGLYGRSFTLASASQTELGAPAKAAGAAGPITKEPGMLGYNEICLSLKNGWKEEWIPKAEVPFAYSGDQWVGYDDKKSIGAKVDYILKNNLGGGMVWSIDTDDFRGKCGMGKYPLLSTIMEKLNGKNMKLPHDTITTAPSRPVTSRPIPGSGTSRPTPGPVTSRPTPGSGQEFTCTEEGYFRDPNQCHLFWWCVKMGQDLTKYGYRCAEDSAFDEHTRACLDKSMVQGC